MLQAPTEVQLSNNVYRVGRADAMTQFHVARRLAPVLAALGVSLMDLLKQAPPAPADGDGAPSLADVDMLAVMRPVMDIVSKMTDEDVEYVIKAALSVVQRQQGDRWAAVQHKGQLVFADIPMTDMIRLAVEFVRENLGGFFSRPPGALP
jgi:hypothetical protein